MLSTTSIAIILFLLLDLLIIYWIYNLRVSISNLQASESIICPCYFVDQYTDPTTGELMPGSPCYVSVPGSGNLMVAYRYNSDGTLECQNYRISDNVIITGVTYETPSTLSSGTSTTTTSSIPVTSSNPVSSTPVTSSNPVTSNPTNSNTPVNSSNPISSSNPVSSTPVNNSNPVTSNPTTTINQSAPIGTTTFFSSTFTGVGGQPVANTTYQPGTLTLDYYPPIFAG
jgi:hypothetical protein